MKTTARAQGDVVLYQTGDKTRICCSSTTIACRGIPYDQTVSDQCPAIHAPSTVRLTIPIMQCGKPICYRKIGNSGVGICKHNAHSSASYQSYGITAVADTLKMSLDDVQMAHIRILICRPCQILPQAIVARLKFNGMPAARVRLQQIDQTFNIVRTIRCTRHGDC